MKTRDIWLISDTHFGHQNILKFTKEDGTRVRPEFDTVQEMDEYMINAWNETVKEGDSVYHLGDVFFGDGWKCVPRLVGRKRLLLGNHDMGKDERLTKYFQKISMWRLFKEHNIMLTHVPIYMWDGDHRKFDVNVHGHIHEKSAPTTAHFNISVERTGYRPIHIEEVAKQASRGNPHFKWDMK